MLATKNRQASHAGVWLSTLAIMLKLRRIIKQNLQREPPG
jgi:hypothetical protein